MDTSLGFSCMPLIVTVPMDGHEVTQFIASSLAFWGNMVDFHTVTMSESPFTPATLSLLLLQKSREFAIQHRVLFESLAPIPKVAIVWTGVPLDLHVSSDGGLAVISQPRSLLSAEYPLVCFIRLPVAIFYPLPVFVGVPTPCP
jgi:hypothetical protein